MKFFAMLALLLAVVKVRPYPLNGPQRSHAQPRARDGRGLSLHTTSPTRRYARPRPTKAHQGARRRCPPAAHIARLCVCTQADYTGSPTAVAPEKLAPEAVFFKLAPVRAAPDGEVPYKMAPTEKLAPQEYKPSHPEHRLAPERMAPEKYDPSPHRAAPERMAPERMAPEKYDPTPHKAVPMHRRPAPESSNTFFVNF
jgi:hypothetical protein